MKREYCKKKGGIEDPPWVYFFVRLLDKIL